jgi:hypothetical protein
MDWLWFQWLVAKANPQPPGLIQKNNAILLIISISCRLWTETS